MGMLGRFTDGVSERRGTALEAAKSVALTGEALVTQLSEPVVGSEWDEGSLYKALPSHNYVPGPSGLWCVAADCCR